MYIRPEHQDAMYKMKQKQEEIKNPLCTEVLWNGLTFKDKAEKEKERKLKRLTNQEIKYQKK